MINLSELKIYEEDVNLVYKFKKDENIDYRIEKVLIFIQENSKYI